MRFCYYQSSLPGFWLKARFLGADGGTATVIEHTTGQAAFVPIDSLRWDVGSFRHGFLV